MDFVTKIQTLHQPSRVAKLDDVDIGAQIARLDPSVQMPSKKPDETQWVLDDKNNLVLLLRWERVIEPAQEALQLAEQATAHDDNSVEALYRHLQRHTLSFLPFGRLTPLPSPSPLPLPGIIMGLGPDVTDWEGDLPETHRGHEAVLMDVTIPITINTRHSSVREVLYPITTTGEPMGNQEEKEQKEKEQDKALPLPRFVVELGRVAAKDNAGRRTRGSEYFAVLDVVGPKRSVWIMYDAFPDDDNGLMTRTPQPIWVDQRLFPGLRAKKNAFDMACLLEDVALWEQTDWKTIQDTVAKTRGIHHPILSYTWTSRVREGCSSVKKV